MVAGGPAEAVAADPRPPGAPAGPGHPGLGHGQDGLGRGQRRRPRRPPRRTLGRFDAWWATAALAGLDWPPDPGDLGAALERLTWWVWDDGMPGTGWILRLAVADPVAGWTAVLDATDHS